MKKFFALVLAVAMVLSMSTAFASLGWAGSTSVLAQGKANVSIKIKALEYSGTIQDFDEFGLNDMTVWKEITGRVVKDTLVKFPIVVTVPGASSSGLFVEDYEGAKITVSLTNATAWKVVDEKGVVYPGITQTGSTLTLNCKEDGSKISHEFTVVARVLSTDAVDCKVSFSMGQTIDNKGKDIRFIANGAEYVAEWRKDANQLAVQNVATMDEIIFKLGADNKFTSDIFFNGMPVNYCVKGEIAFNGNCACTAYTGSALINEGTYRDYVARFDAILKAIGFSFSYGAVDLGYCTAAGLKSLTVQTSASNSVSVGACTELSVNTTTPTVSIPQTGAVSVVGYALVALAGAALAISKKN